AHRALEARFGSYLGATLPAAYDTVDKECRRARESASLFDTNYHAIFELAGADRARYLNAVTSGDIKSLTPGHGALGLLLNAQGHILAELETYALEDRFLILSHASVAARTLETLDKFIIMDDCTLTDVSSQWATCALEGPRAAEVLRGVCEVALSELGPLGHQEAQIASAPCRILQRSHFDLPAPRSSRRRRRSPASGRRSSKPRARLVAARSDGRPSTHCASKRASAGSDTISTIP